MNATPTILLVQDVARCRLMAANLLRGEGYAVLEARDVAEASAIAGWRLGEIDLLLAEAGLPGGGAATLAETLRQFRPGLPVLLMSAGGLRGAIRLARSRDIMPFLNAVRSAIHNEGQ